MSKTILIVGANSALARETIPILALDNTIVTAGRINCDVYCNITEAVVVPKGIDIVINFSAAFDSLHEESAGIIYKTNTLGLLNVCMGAKVANVPYVINISSAFALLSPSSTFYSTYALSKKHADELADHYCKENSIALLTLRPSQIYADSNAQANHHPFFYKIVNAAEKGEDITLFGEGSSQRNFIHSSDVAEIIARSIKLEIVGSYNCVYSENVSYKQIAETALSVFGKGGTIVFDQEKTETLDNNFSSDTALFDLIDYTPSIDIKTGISRIKAHRERS